MGSVVRFLKRELLNFNKKPFIEKNSTVRPNPLVPPDDWNPSKSESSCPLQKPWLLTLTPSGGGGGVLKKLLTHPTSLAGPVSIGSPSPAVESIVGGVPAPFACDLLCLGLKWSCEVSWSRLKPLSKNLASRAGGVGRYS